MLREWIEGIWLPIDGWIRLLRAVEQDPFVRVPGQFVMIGRVVATLGGVIMHYRPTLDLQRTRMPVFLSALASHGPGVDTVVET